MSWRTNETIIITFVGNKFYEIKSQYLHTTFWSRQIFCKNMLSSPSIAFTFSMKSRRCNTPRTQGWSSKCHCLTSKRRAHVAIGAYKVRTSQSGTVHYEARSKVIGYDRLSHVLSENIFLSAVGQHATLRRQLRMKRLLL